MCHHSHNLHLGCDNSPWSGSGFDQAGLHQAVEELHHVLPADLGFDIEVGVNVVADLGDRMRRFQEVPDMRTNALQPEIQRLFDVQNGDFLVEDARHLGG